MMTITWRTKILFLFIIVVGGSFLFQMLYLFPFIKADNIEVRTEQQAKNAAFIALEIENTVKRFKSRITGFTGIQDFSSLDTAAISDILTANAAAGMLLSAELVLPKSKTTLKT